VPASNPHLNNQAKKHKSFQKAASSPVVFEAKNQKIDGFARILLNTQSQQHRVSLCEKLNLSANMDASGQLIADVFIQLNDPAALNAVLNLGIKTRSQVGDILVARAPIEVLSALAEEPGIRRIEISTKRQAKLDSSIADIGADLVHQGTDLPQAYQGEEVVVGVIDSGIDFTHPDFSDQNGSRIQYLLEYTEGGGQNEWTKSIIDSNPGSITQRDGDGSGGHGSHVTGIAAGGGQMNSAMKGVAPASDIIFVKGVREQDSDGGFVDTDVIAGCQYIFNKADQMGKPAVINLSIGGHFGPHDGTSLYEQSLSGLVGPGKLIVAAAGNEGDDFIHAGGNATTNVLNETVFIADSADQRAGISMWYETGVISAVAVFAYDAQFNFLGQAQSIGVGYSLDSYPVVVNNDTLGFVTIDAQTTQDPNNGDGNAIFVIDNNNNPAIDISDVIWAVGSQTVTDGRVDLWTLTGGRFYDQVVGFPNETEMPGNNDYSTGPPATAQKVISVGSYVTKNSWINIDDGSYTLSPPPTVATLSAFSSKGPTRDGRISPDITAPGQFIFSALSSHLTEGIGYSRLAVLQGGGYQGQNGTSQASPHIAGTIALMLQVKNDLTYDETIQFFSETARTNQYTGNTPNNNVGPGYLDAYAAVKKVVGLVNSVENTDHTLPGSFVLKQNYPNPFNPSTNIEYSLATVNQVALKIYNVTGQQIKTLVNKTQKAGTYTIQWDGTNDTGQYVASGIYYIKLKASQFVQTRKMVLMR
jgi:minor extracellular serine protease Vpr